MQQVIEYIDPNPRTWDNPEGKTFYFVEAKFEDGSLGSTMAFSPAQAKEHVDALTALRGQRVEYKLEANGEYQGQQKWKIKDYPGKPAGGGGRGGGGSMSPEHVALMAAASALGPQLTVDIPMSVQAAMIQELQGLLLQGSNKAGEGPELNGGSASPATPVGGVTASPAPPSDPATLSQIKKLWELGAAKGYTPELLPSALGVEKLGDLSQEDAKLLITEWS